MYLGPHSSLPLPLPTARTALPVMHDNSQFEGERSLVHGLFTRTRLHMVNFGAVVYSV